MFGTFIKNVGSKGSQVCRPVRTSISNTYASSRVHTPDPATSSNESLNNNPALIFTCKRKKGVIYQHSELVIDTCDIPGCEGKRCRGLCSKKVASTTVAHFTHSDDPDLETHEFSHDDFDSSGKTLYVKPYETPHETSGSSVNPTQDSERTEKLKKMLENIDANNK